MNKARRLPIGLGRGGYWQEDVPCEVAARRCDAVPVLGMAVNRRRHESRQKTQVKFEGMPGRVGVGGKPREGHQHRRHLGRPDDDGVEQSGELVDRRGEGLQIDFKGKSYRRNSPRSARSGRGEGEDEEQAAEARNSPQQKGEDEHELITIDKPGQQDGNGHAASWPCDRRGREKARSPRTAAAP
jgi:hypothetical protein